MLLVAQFYPVRSIFASRFSCSSVFCCSTMVCLSARNLPYSSGSKSLTISIPQDRAAPMSISHIWGNVSRAFGGSWIFSTASSYKCFNVIFPAISAFGYMAPR